MLQTLRSAGVDQLLVEWGGIRWLSFTVARIKLRFEKFQTAEKRTVVWLLLRYSIFRAAKLLKSSICRAMKLTNRSDMLNLSMVFS